MTFKQDRLENEKNDPTEGSSLRFINVPLILISLFVGFGVSYLAMKTPNTSMTPGDTRTMEAAKPAGDGQAITGEGDPAAVMEKGKQVFATICQACHQATGAGVPGAFPPLIESEWVNGPPKQVAAIILRGLQGDITVKGQKFNGAMPAFVEVLKPEEIAAVATYVRNSFGNKSSAVSVELVKEVLENTKSKTIPWNGEADLKTQKWE